MNFKELEEKRADLQAEMEAIVSKANGEQRAMTPEEVEAFDKKEKEIRAIDDTLKRAEAARNAQSRRPAQKTTEQMEERAFADYIFRRAQEMRAEGQSFGMSANGAVIPTTIADRIIKEVKDRCPILANATIYNVAGTLKVPVYNGTDGITVGYSEDFTELTASAGKFAPIDLGGYLIGALTLVGRSLQNSAAVDVVQFVVTEMAEQIAIFVEGQLLNGTGSNACTGALSTTNTVEAGSATAISADDLIKLQANVKQAYQHNACWTMSPATFVAIKQLKDDNKRYLVQDDFSGEFPYRLLGKPVYLSDNMPEIASGAKPILYGDYSGLTVNIREAMSIQVLHEQYATQHAIGVVGYMELDSKVTNHQKLATLVMA